MWKRRHESPERIRFGYCFTPYQRLWLYNGAPLVAFYDTLGIRRTYFRLNPRRPHGGTREEEDQECSLQTGQKALVIIRITYVG